MKIFKNFVSLLLMAILLIPALPNLFVMAAPLDVEMTEFGKEYVLYKEDFNSGTIDDYLNSSDGYSVNAGAGTYTKIVERTAGDSALNVGIDNASGTMYKFRKTFSKTWAELLQENSITPQAGDYLIFYLEVCAGIANTYFFESDYVSKPGGNMGMFKGAQQFRDAKEASLKTTGLSKTKWYDLKFIYKYGASTASHIATIFDDEVLTNAVSSGYRTIPYAGLPWLSFNSSWGVAKFDNIKVSFVKHSELACEVQSEDVNPYNPIRLSFDRKVVSGEVSIKDADTVIESSGDISGKSIELNTLGNLGCDKTYTIELKNIKDIYGEVVAEKSITIKTAGKTDVAAGGAVVSELKNISVLIGEVPTSAELSSVKLCYSDGGGDHEVPITGSSYEEDASGNIKLNIPIDQNLRTATAYTIKMGTAELASFTTKDGVNVTRPVFSLVSPGSATIKAEVTCDNVTNFAGINTATLMLMYFEGDKLIKISTSPVVDITSGANLEAEIDLSGFTPKPNSKLKTFVISDYANMYPLTASTVVEQ